MNLGLLLGSYTKCPYRAFGQIHDGVSEEGFESQQEGCHLFLLGLNAYHGDAAACLLRDGNIIAAAEEERFRRIKHWAGFPSEATRYCLVEAGVKQANVDHIAINSNPKANLPRRLQYAITQRPDLKLILDRVRNQSKRLRSEEHT